MAIPYPPSPGPGGPAGETASLPHDIPTGPASRDLARLGLGLPGPLGVVAASLIRRRRKPPPILTDPPRGGGMDQWLL
ncbi:hypothetical protein [Actinoplanes solisilvae]|uniref:hypothetical protein n=1 Tax=Actinoplanes solisilvae TaxID=2486853 RepID=UPI000FD78FEC|nr:hypothetical protein [Actinoplanes solisilvae]